MESPTAPARSRRLADLGVEDTDIVRVYRTFHADREPFKSESIKHEH